MSVSPVINRTMMHIHLLFPVVSVMCYVVTIRPEGILFVPQKHRPDKNRCKFIITFLCTCHVPTVLLCYLCVIHYVACSVTVRVGVVTLKI